MTNPESQVERHYGVGGILDSILAALTTSGKDVGALAPGDLAPVDEFHIRGREATVELAGRAAIRPGIRILDIGSGIGGSARYLASERDCEVTGIDLSEEYVAVATELARRVGLDDKVTFKRAGALDLPMGDASFDLVWTEHVQMNIEDKDTFYSEIHRVLRPGGPLAFHDIFLGDAGDPHYPLPWASDPSISHLWPLDRLRAALERAGFEIRDWEDKSAPSLEWFEQVVEKLKQSGPQPLGLHLLMGKTSAEKMKNQIQNFKENRLTVIQAVALSKVAQ